jgi:hypothetical protein
MRICDWVRKLAGRQIVSDATNFIIEMPHPIYPGLEQPASKADGFFNEVVKKFVEPVCPISGNDELAALLSELTTMFLFAESLLHRSSFSDRTLSVSGGPLRLELPSDAIQKWHPRFDPSAGRFCSAPESIPLLGHEGRLGSEDWA